MLEFVVFQCESVWICFDLANPTLGIGANDDLGVLSSRSESCLFANSLSIVGEFRCIFEFYGVAAELN